jgi:hypothetical protein
MKKHKKVNKKIKETLLSSVMQIKQEKILGLRLADTMLCLIY